MHQRCRVNDFDDGAQPDRALPLIVEQFCRKEQQRRANSSCRHLARRYSLISVMALDAGDCIATELALQRDEVVPQQVEYFFSVNGGRCAQMNQTLGLRISDFGLQVLPVVQVWRPDARFSWCGNS